jgi:hypothetical protein
VSELLDRIIEGDLSDVARTRARHRVLLGVSKPAAHEDGKAREVSIDAYGSNVLVAGPSSSGKSRVATAILERLMEQGYQLCLVDPEGDYERFDQTVCLGSPARAPSVDEVMQLLAKPEENAVVNLLGLPLADRPRFFAELFPRLQEMRTRTGRPHWIVIDEAHHLLPSAWYAAPLALPQRLGETLLVTVHPDHVAPAVLSAIDTAIAVGGGVKETFGALARAIGVTEPRPPPVPEAPLADGEVLVWRRCEAVAPLRVTVTPARAERMRHRRKYAQGELGDHSFYFRGPRLILNLRAQNLLVFAQIADGVDDETWLHHLYAGDYARWFREKVKDPELAEEAEVVARDTSLSARASRACVRVAIERRYSLPA